MVSARLFLVGRRAAVGCNGWNGTPAARLEEIRLHVEHASNPESEHDRPRVLQCAESPQYAGVVADGEDGPIHRFVILVGTDEVVTDLVEFEAVVLERLVHGNDAVLAEDAAARVGQLDEARIASR